MTKGVYRITDLMTNTSYIGSSKNIEARIVTHYSDLEQNIHHNYNLQDSYNFYKTLDIFTYEVLEETSNLISREIYWTLYEKLTKGRIYNIQLANKRDIKMYKINSFTDVRIHCKFIKGIERLVSIEQLNKKLIKSKKILILPTVEPIDKPIRLRTVKKKVNKKKLTRKQKLVKQRI